MKTDPESPADTRAEVKALIEDALKRAAELDARPVMVEIPGRCAVGSAPEAPP
jgi:hypothetical protein